MSNPYSKQVTTADFQTEVLQASLQVPVLVDFWADWCGPCKNLMPVLEKLSEDYAGAFILAKINADEEQMLCAQIGVRSLPTVVLFVDGQPVDHFQGALPESEVKAFLAKHVQPNDPRVQAIRSHLQQQQHALALPLIEEYWLVNKQAEVASWMLSALVGLERFDEAKQWLESLPANLRLEPEIEQWAANIQILSQQQDLPELKPLQQAYEQLENAENAENLALALAKAKQFQSAFDLLLAEFAKDKTQTQLKACLLDMFSQCKDSTLVNNTRRKLFSLMH